MRRPPPLYRGPWRAALRGLPGVEECDAGFRWRPKRSGAWALIRVRGASADVVVGLARVGPVHCSRASTLALEAARMLDACHQTASRGNACRSLVERMVSGGDRTLDACAEVA